MLAHETGRVEPAKPILGDVFLSPKRGVAGPESRRRFLLPRELDAARGVVLPLAQPLAELHLLHAPLRGGARLDGVQEAVEGLGEELESIVGELLADLLEIDAQLGQLAQLRARLLRSLRDRLRHLAVVVEGLQRAERHGVDGVLADERLDVVHVAVSLVLGAGRGPERPLAGGALRLQRLPAGGGDGLQENLVSLLCICIGDLALQIS